MLEKIIIKNRSYRRFDESYEISEKQLLKIIENTRYCPTARNQQVLMYKIITEKDLRSEIFPHLKWAGYLKDWAGPAEGERPTAYVIIAVNKNRQKINDDWTNTDLGIALQTILLQTNEIGIGGCAIASFNKTKIKEIINSPEHIEPKIIIALGKPAENVKITDIEDEDEIKYFREGETHIVPKRILNDIIF